MFTPNFNQDQYLDADSFNTAANNVSGSIASGLIASCFPGLVNDNSGSYTASGLLVSAFLPAPFGVIFGTGILANAHGVVTGADTETYVINFSGLVPVSGAPVTAYGVASYQQIQQTAIAITGPPPGHPDYNPNFVPYTGYQINVDSLAVSATTTPADNLTTFELFRTTLTSGLVSLGTLNTAYQQRRAPHAIFQSKSPAVTGTLTSEYINYLTVSGAYTLPAASISNGQLINVTSAVSGACTITASGSDRIYGFYPTPASGVPSFSLTDGNSATLGGINGNWQLLQGTSAVMGGASPYGANPSGVISGGYLSITGSTTLQFANTYGPQVPISGVFQTIPGTPITISNSGLAINTTYFVYVFMNSGVMTLGLTTSSSWIYGANGYLVAAGNAAFTLVGMVETSSVGQFLVLSAVDILCLNLYNQQPLPGYVAVNGSASSNTFTELDSTKRIFFLSWPSAILMLITGEQSNNTAGNNGGTCTIGLDGSQWTQVAGGGENTVANAQMPTTSFANLPVTEGFHYMQTMGNVNALGVSTFFLATTLTVMG